MQKLLFIVAAVGALSATGCATRSRVAYQESGYVGTPTTSYGPVAGQSVPLGNGRCRMSDGRIGYETTSNGRVGCRANTVAY